jgi:hypothetical protein
MLKMVLRRHLVTGRFGLLGQFQTTAVLRHGASIAGLVSPPPAGPEPLFCGGL